MRTGISRFGRTISLVTPKSGSAVSYTSYIEQQKATEREEKRRRNNKLNKKVGSFFNTENCNLNDFSFLKNVAECNEINAKNNNFEDFSGMIRCSHLQILDIRNCNITSFKNYVPQPNLHSIFVEGNPISSSPFFNSLALMVFGFQLKYVDGKAITKADIETADRFKVIDADGKLSNVPVLSLLYRGWMPDFIPKNIKVLKEADAKLNEKRRKHEKKLNDEMKAKAEQNKANKQDNTTVYLSKYLSDKDDEKQKRIDELQEELDRLERINDEEETKEEDEEQRKKEEYEEEEEDYIEEDDDEERDKEKVLKNEDNIEEEENVEILKNKDNIEEEEEREKVEVLKNEDLFDEENEEEEIFVFDDHEESLGDAEEIDSYTKAKLSQTDDVLCGRCLESEENAFKNDVIESI